MDDLEPNCPRQLRTGIDEEAQYAMSKAWWKIDNSPEPVQEHANADCGIDQTETR